MSDKDLHTIKSLVGDTITNENLLFVDSFVYDELSMFMPIGGNCGYAITPNHKHPSYMFTLHYDNQSVVYIDNQKFQAEPNTIFCLSPEIEHHEVQNYLPPKYCAIFIKKELFEEAFKSYSKEVLLLNGLIADMKNSKLEMLIKEFMAESQNQHSSKDLLLENLSTLITHEIIRTILKYSTHTFDMSDNAKINEAVKFMNINYEQNITLDDLAKISQLSKSHFTKLFSDSMNVSPMEYLKIIRLQNSKKMLLTNELSITQVSQQCGFNSPSYFTKSFKDSFRETPKEFMQRAN